MRIRDIEIGSTYLVFVPHRLPVDRYPDLFTPGAPAWSWGWLRGCRFRFTVTEIDPPLVSGLRILDTAQARIELTDEQCAELGLPLGHYRLVGTLFDDQNRMVRLPEVRAMEVPARWLQPVTDTPPRSHCDVDSIGL